MHIILGMLGSMISILYLLDRLGVDIGWINPWSWRRRQAWAKKFGGDPIYSVEEPVDVAAMMIVGTIKLEGDLTVEQKASVLSQFEKRFSLDSRAASALFSSAAHLLGGPQVIGMQLDGLASRHKNTFKPDQVESMIGMIENIAVAGGRMSEVQRTYVESLRSNFVSPSPKKGTWT